MNGIGNVWKAGILLTSDLHFSERIKNFFISKGMCHAENIKPDCFLFKGNDVTTAAKIINENEISNRNSFLEAVLSATSLMNSANYVYLVLPKLFTSTIEGDVIEKYGIGIITYDQRNVEEVVSARFIQILNQDPITSHASRESYQALLEEMCGLKDRLKSVEYAIESISSELKLLKTMTKPTLINTNANSLLQTSGIIEDVPSFMKDNPWVDVLSRRGRESAG